MANARSLADAREAALLHPGDARHALAHGEALLKAGRLPEAIGELQRALRLDHESAQARHALGRAWLAAGEAPPQDARPCATRAILAAG